MIINTTYLVTRNARDKVQVVITVLEQIGNKFVIQRTTGQYQGKMTNQPQLTIERGKSTRSVIQQAELEYASILNKYQDKGYKKLSSLTDDSLEELTPEELNSLVPTIKSDSNGNFKPMLAKDHNKCQNSVLNKPMLCSRKLNGVRCMMRWDLTLGRVVTISRGGKDYNCSTALIAQELEPYLRSHPDIILDGELYNYGHSLQELSGIARLQTWEPRCELLQFWIYDIADASMKFIDRLDLLEELGDIVEEGELNRVKVLEHELTESWADVMRLHDRWVAEGFEGAVARKPDKGYEFGRRSSTMIKIKAYQDGEFLIIDYKDGLRDEDFCFICETADGKVFSAKPIGDRALRAWYLENINDIIGEKGKVKYFELSDDGVPVQTIFQAVRYAEDIESDE